MSASSALHLLCAEHSAAREHCLAHWAAGDELLLVDRGARLLADPGWLALATARFGRSPAALRADVQACGLERMARDGAVDLVDEGGWVRRVARHRHVLTWK